MAARRLAVLGIAGEGWSKLQPLPQREEKLFSCSCSQHHSSFARTPAPPTPCYELSVVAMLPPLDPHLHCPPNIVPAPPGSLPDQNSNAGYTLVCDCEDPAWAEDGETSTVEGGKLVQAS
ncbi:hypothetical protein P7K49_008769 [Saguinus oedipus]|uniref:Uncharacterized protein n=1 Tax=Saguinus oedipus TaxID=9490 RepID=A0ABQ9W113_SAGOE|nr:hypothetical protein P7K49_008769 [Saguinus oedipus]